MPDFDELVADPQMRRELGGISDMTTWRWDHDLARAPNGWEPPNKDRKPPQIPHPRDD